MYIDTDSNFFSLFPMFLIILVAIFLFALLAYFLLLRQDDKKELIKRNVKVLEKPLQQGNIEWYIVECQNGERLKLRNIQANTIIISVGDKGIIEYRGKTIQSFKRQK
jgi:hypothetical protein